ncbi:hypothetical protein [Lacipirellula limnantheis]|uniref:Uncharacterized protein n=1 Tax=Lacipirellula limnantheis TaxID=2528024 RepID=A0A517U6F9_9BACT|nr:hypothetical protein [Lacipirellula limnantheis]QDT76219.1 hypothetical protein I41_54640 [Lacipirellula limnantheis]
MTLRQLQQVTIHHLSRPKPWSWLLGAVLMLFALYSLADWVSNPPGTTSLTLPTLIFPVFALCLFPYLQVRQHAILWQFDNPQAALLPGYRTPHLLFLLVVAVITMAIVPCTIAALASISPWFLLAVCALLGAGLLFPSMTGLIVPFIILFQLDLDAAFVKPWMLAEGFRLPVLVAIAAVSWRTIGLHAFDASSGREEGTRLPLAFLKRTDWRFGKTAEEKQLGPASRPHWLQLAWNSSRLDRQISRMRNAGVYAKVRTGIARTSSNAPGGALQLVPLLAIGVIILWRSEESISFDQSNWEFMTSTLPFLTLAAALAPAVSLANRIPQMAFERLLPMTNQTFANALIYNALRSSIRWWLVAHAAALAALKFLPWEYLEPPSQSTMTVYVFISLSCLLFGNGAALIGALTPGFFAAFIVGAPSVAVCVGLPGFWSSLNPGQSNMGVLIAAAFFAAVGVSLIALARTNWRDREFGNR